MRRYASLYSMFLKNYLQSLMQSKVDFFLGLFGFFMTQASGIAFLYFVFDRIPNLNGWNFYEILFIYGFAQLPRGIDHLFTDYIWLLSWKLIVNGEFDKYLIRPINPLFHLIADRFQPDALGEIIVGVGMVAISIPHIDMHWTMMKVIAFCILVICGSIIYTSVKLFFASLAFWMKNSFPLLCMVYRFADFGKYPISIYSKGIQWFISYIIPFAFVTFFPAEYLLGKGSIWQGFIGVIIVTIVSVCISYATWYKGLSVYESAGS